MKISLKNQIEVDPTLPVGPVNINTGSALRLELADIPTEMSGGTVAAVAVTITNADGAAVTGTATYNEDTGCWDILFAASNFASYGFVEYGLHVAVSVMVDDSTFTEIYVGDFEVAQASASAMPGDPTASYVTKGGDQYLKTQVVDDVQHYTKLSMVNHEQLGWTLTTDGDYILVDGEFVEAE